MALISQLDSILSLTFNLYSWIVSIYEFEEPRGVKV